MKRAFDTLPSTSCRGDESKRKRIKTINVLFVCDEWKSSKGGLSTFNREFAINVAKTSSDKISVHCYVSQSNEQEREDARKHGVNIITAQSVPGTCDCLEWLKLPPPELLHPDIVIGHGRKFGTPAYFIARTTHSKWVQFVHVFCEDLGKYKVTAKTGLDTIEENEKKNKTEIEFCRAADAVVAVGARLQRKYSRTFPKIEIITPSILKKFSSESAELVKASRVLKTFNVFMFGRADFEDLRLKGYDLVANAIGSLGKKFELTFVGSPEGEHTNIVKWFTENTSIKRNQITIRSYCTDQDELKRMFYEADLVAMPSCTEGFGLVALEAISASTPVLVTSESGIAEALEKVKGGKSVVVESEDPEEWFQKIRLLSEQKPEERHDSAIHLRENYEKTYSWEEECGKFTKMILGLLEDHDKGCSVSSIHQKPVTADSNDSDHASDKPVPAESINSDHAKAKPVPADSKESDHASAKAVNNLTDKIEMLHSATKNGNIELIELMLSFGLDINSRDRFGITPLMVAASNNEPDAFRHLIQHGADPSLKNKGGWSMLHFAAQGGNTSIINKLLSLGLDTDSKCSYGSTPLMVAAEKGKPDAFQLLIQHDADPSLKSKFGSSLLHRAAEGGNTSIIEKLLSLGLDIDSRSNDNDTPLMIAAKCDKPAAFQLFIQHGADPSLKSNYGFSLLHCAAEGGNTSIIEKLLSFGLDIDSRSSVGFTPLMHAAIQDKQAAFQLFIQHGADPSLKSNDGWSLLHVAAQGESTAIINKLLLLGLDTDLRSSDGTTPLMVAAYNEKPATFQLLMQHGADPSLKNSNGWSLLHFAARGENTSIIDKLLSLGLDIHLRNSEGKTPLMVAIEEDSSQAIKHLISKGALELTETDCF